MKLDSAKVIKSFEAGGVVVFPTDTVYGIGCVYDDEDAVKKIFKLKLLRLNIMDILLVKHIRMLH